MDAIDRLSDGLAGHEVTLCSVLFLNGEIASENISGIRNRMRVPLHHGVRGNRYFKNSDLGLTTRVCLVRHSIPRRGSLDERLGLDLTPRMLRRGDTAEKGREQCDCHELPIRSALAGELS